MSEDVTVRFGADTSSLNAGVDKAKSFLAQFTDAVRGTSVAVQGVGNASKTSSEQISQYASGVGKAIGGITLGVGAAVAAAVGFMEKTGAAAVAFVEPIRAAAGAFDQTVQSMSGVNAVATRTGAGLNELGSAFHTLQTKAKAGDEDTVSALNAIGLKARDVADLSQDALAVKMAEAFSTTRDSANKAAVGAALFGDAAGKLVPQLDLGAARMKDLQDAADRAGTVIGPELAAKVQGTNMQFERFGDRMQELRETADGSMLKTFQQIKPALDGANQAFSDVVGNVTGVIESFGGLDGAGRKNVETTGLLSTVAKAFADVLIDVIAYVEEWGVKQYQTLVAVGLGFEALVRVGSAFGEDIRSIAKTSSDSLYNAFNEAITGVVTLFGNLAEAGKAALTFDVSGVSSAFAKIGTDAQAARERVSAAISPDLFSNTKRAYSEMEVGAAAAAKSIDTVIDRIHKQADAAHALVAAGGVKGSAVPQTRDAGAIPKHDDDDGKSDRDRVQAALRALEGEVQAVKQAEERKHELIAAGVQLDMVSQGQKVAATRAALDEELAAEMAIYEREKQIDGLKLAQKQEILNKIKAAQAAHDNAVLRSEIDAAVKTHQAWQNAASEISSTLGSQINGLLTKTTTFAQAFKNIMTSALESIIRKTIDYGVQHAATIAENIVGTNSETAAKILGATAGASAQSAGAAASIASTLASVMKSITASAGQAFAGVTGFLAPVMGPAAVGPAAMTQAEVLAVGAGLGIYDTGAWSLPRDQFAAVHAGEMIVPSRGGVADEFRGFMAGGGFGGKGGGGQGGGGDTHNHYSPKVEFHGHGHLTDAQIDRSMGRIAKNLRDDYRRNHGKGW